MTDNIDTKQSYRFRLGPVVSKLLDDLPEATSASLDAKVQSLLERNEELERHLDKNHEVIMAQIKSNQMLSENLYRVSTGVSLLYRYVETRMTDLCHLMMHFGENLGTHFAADEQERELRAKRMRSIEERAQARIERLGDEINAEHENRDHLITQLSSRFEEERLSFIELRQREHQRVHEQGRER